MFLWGHILAKFYLKLSSHSYILSGSSQDGEAHNLGPVEVGPVSDWDVARIESEASKYRSRIGLWF